MKITLELNVNNKLIQKVVNLICDNESNDFKENNSIDIHYNLDKYLLTIWDLELTVRSTNVLINEGIFLVGDLTSLPEGKISQFDNLGRRSLGEIKEALASRQLLLGETHPKWNDYFALKTRLEKLHRLKCSCSLNERNLRDVLMQKIHELTGMLHAHESLPQPNHHV